MYFFNNKIYYFSILSFDNTILNIYKLKIIVLHQICVTYN